jgi:hypothetical protein
MTYLAKYITTVLILTYILVILLGHLNSIYVCRRFPNYIEQHANIDHNNDVDNNVNLATA